MGGCGGGGSGSYGFCVGFCSHFWNFLGEGGRAGDSGDRLRVFVGLDLVFVRSLRYWPHVAQTSCYGSTGKSGGKRREGGGVGEDQAEGKGQHRQEGEDQGEKGGGGNGRGGEDKPCGGGWKGEAGKGGRGWSDIVEGPVREMWTKLNDDKFFIYRC